MTDETTDNKFATVRVGATDLINDILIAQNKEPLFTDGYDLPSLLAKAKPNARAIVESAIATYYNLIINEDGTAIKKIKELPQFEKVNARFNYDLERLK